MYENLIAILIVVLITMTAKEKYLLGILVAAYYGVYMCLELDFLGVVTSWIYSTHEEFTQWYLVYTAISFLFFILSIALYANTGSKTALLYSGWILFNIIISGLSAIFQSFETNIFLNVYNVVQNINLLVDIVVVIVGTDNVIRNSNCVSGIIDYYNIRFSRYFFLPHVNVAKDKKCQQKI
jgi:hypothetical protein